MSKRMLQTLFVVSLLVVGLVACTPGESAQPVESADLASESSTSTEGTTMEDAAEPAYPTTNDSPALDTVAQDNPDQSVSVGDSGDVVVESTPLSEEQLANQPPGSSPGGAGESGSGGGGSAPYPSLPEEEEINPAEWPVYSDPTYKFSVGHPADFVIRPLDSAQLAEFNPAPSASIRFMSPAIANSDLGDMDIPELNMRIFPAPQDASLENWLTSSGLVSNGDNMAAYQNAAVSGVKVCLATLLAPNCFIYVMGNGWVYQLTPLGLVGEAMVDSFALSS